METVTLNTLSFFILPPRRGGRMKKRGELLDAPLFRLTRPTPYNPSSLHRFGVPMHLTEKFRLYLQ